MERRERLDPRNWKSVPTATSAKPWWKYDGIGWPSRLSEVSQLKTIVAILVAFVIWGYVDVSRRGQLVNGHPEYHRTDFTVFTEAGAALFDGRNPYEVTNARGWFYLYPPLFAMLVAPLSASDTVSQVTIWFGISIALGFGCYAESRRIWRLIHPASSDVGGGCDVSPWVGVCAGLAVALPTLDCLQRGQIGIALVYPLLLGFRLTLGGGSWWSRGLGGVILAWPVVVKLIPALPVGCLVLQQWAAVFAAGRDRNSTVARALASTSGLAVGAIVFLLLLPASFLGWDANLGHLNTWARKVATNQDVGKVHGFHFDSLANQSLTNATHLLAAKLSGREVSRTEYPHWFAFDTEVANRRRAASSTHAFTLIARGLVLALLGSIVLRVGLREDPPGQAAAFGLAGMAIVLVSPLAWAHYFVLWLPAILTVPPWLAGRGHIRAAKWLCVVPVFLTWSQYLATRWVGQIGLLGLGSMVWFLAVCAVSSRVLARKPDKILGAFGILRADDRHEKPLPGRHPAVLGRSTQIDVLGS